MVKSTVLTSSGLVEGVSCQLHSVNITKVATGTGTVVVYDNTSAAGRIVFQGDGLAEASFVLGNFAGGGAICAKGIYVSLGGSTNATVVVTYE